MKIGFAMVATTQAVDPATNDQPDKKTIAPLVRCGGKLIPEG